MQINYGIIVISKYIIHLMIYNNEKNRLWNLTKQSILMLKQLAKEITLADMNNEGFVKDWIDDLEQIIKDYDLANEEKESSKDYLRIKAEQMVDDIDSLWDQLEPYKHEQFVLNVSDRLNSISVRY